MYAIRKLLITLDMSAMDDSLIPYGFRVASLMDSEEVILMHVLTPKSLSKHGDGKAIEQIIQEKINPHKSILLSHTKVQIALPSGDPLTEMMTLSKKESIDMLVVGRKNIVEGTGETSRKLARRALCSILRVPENASAEFKRILIPIDFSEYSVNAIERAIDFSKRMKGVEIICLNIFELPKGYLSSGKSVEEFAEIMETNARKRYKHFMKQFDAQNVNIRAKFQLDRHGAKAKIISNIALVENANIIVMGSRGRTSMAAALLGSTTEKLLLHNLTVPMLILKRKEQNLGFFEALLNI